MLHPIGGPGRWWLLVMFALGCGSSDTGSGSSSGCGSSGTTGRCEIVSEGTACGDRIPVECFDGAEPEAEAQCEKAIEQDDEVLYCCTSAAEGEGAGAAAGTAADTGADTGSSTAATSDTVTTGAGGGGGGGSPGA